MKILIAEDEPVSRAKLSISLEKWGYDLALAKDGQEALDLALEEDAPDLLILDWMMPKKSGIEVCEEIRKLKNNNYRYIILLTAKDAKEDVISGLASGADDYITKPFSLNELQVRIKAGERVLQLHKELSIAFTENRRILESIPSLLICIDSQDRIIRWNIAAESIFGKAASKMIGCNLLNSHLEWDWYRIILGIEQSRTNQKLTHVEEVEYLDVNGKKGFIDLIINPLTGVQTEPSSLLIIGRDVTDKRILERQLVQAQKLESIGQLAAGIAHEINTPSQYIGDNLRFLFEEFSALLSPLKHVEEFIESQDDPKTLASMIESFKGIDISYLIEEMPEAFQQSIEGLTRVVEIVQAMKDFSHPGSKDKVFVDLNSSIKNTITISRNEWKYDAELKTEFSDDVPEVPCFPGELNQVILNMIVNASHAIAGANNELEREKGAITIRTSTKDNYALIEIEDNGTGIRQEHCQKIFDPFFTTKEVGRGTGQGLSICYSIIVDKHQGKIDFNTELGKGTKFTIYLPTSEENKS